MEAFLSRWSRRKLEAKENPPAAPPEAELADTAPAAPYLSATAPAAPGSAQSMSPEYREFFDPGVDEKLRRAALRELFSEPQFNVMDGLDTYIDDYSKADPIPDAMLRQLNQAKELLLYDDEKPPEPVEGEEAVAASPAEAVPEQLVDAGTLSDPPRVRASDESAEVVTCPAAPAEGKDKK